MAPLLASAGTLPRSASSTLALPPACVAATSPLAEGSLGATVAVSCGRETPQQCQTREQCAFSLLLQEHTWPNSSACAGIPAAHVGPARASAPAVPAGGATCTFPPSEWTAGGGESPDDGGFPTAGGEPVRVVVSLGALLARESASLPIGRMRVLSRRCRGMGADREQYHVELSTRKNSSDEKIPDGESNENWSWHLKAWRWQRGDAVTKRKCTDGGATLSRSAAHIEG